MVEDLGPGDSAVVVDGTMVEDFAVIVIDDVVVFDIPMVDDATRGSVPWVLEDAVIDFPVVSDGPSVTDFAVVFDGAIIADSFIH